MKVSVITLGCKVNQYESQAMLDQLVRAGFSACESAAESDIVLINSCTVTSTSDHKVRQTLHRARRGNPSAVIVLTGCMPQAFPELAEQLTDADIVLGNSNRHSLVPDILQYLSSRQRIVDIVPHEKAAEFESMQVERFFERTRAFIKIEDGCNRFCSYCIIPYARGRVRSKPLEELREEVEHLAANGYREIVLTGINLSAYGQELGLHLCDAVEAACMPEGIARVRLGSLEPEQLSADVIARLAKQDKLCPQFHLSLQSGCDKTLRAMRRPYTTAQYADIAAKLRAAFGTDNVSFTTDVIVGFPGETEDDFEASMAFVTGMRFLKVHVFPYSRREGTAAYDFADQLPEHEKEARSRRMTAAVEEVRAAEAAAMQGRKASVLLETPLSATMFTGYTKQYLPVLVSAPGHKTGDIVEVTLGAWDGKRCRAEIV